MRVIHPRKHKPMHTHIYLTTFPSRSNNTFFHRSFKTRWKNAERVLIFRYQFTQYVQRPIWYFWLNSRSCLKWAKSLCVISCVCWLKICHSSSAKKVLFEKPPLAISQQAFQHWFPCIIRHIQLAFNKKRYILPDFLFSFLCYDFMKPFRMLWQPSRPLQTTKSWRK